MPPDSCYWGDIEGRIEIMRSLGRRRKQLLDDLKKTGRYCKWKEEALDRTLWRTRYGYKLWTFRKTQ